MCTEAHNKLNVNWFGEVERGDGVRYNRNDADDSVVDGMNMNMKIERERESWYPGRWKKWANKMNIKHSPVHHSSNVSN